MIIAESALGGAVRVVFNSLSSLNSHEAKSRFGAVKERFCGISAGYVAVKFEFRAKAGS